MVSYSIRRDGMIVAWLWITFSGTVSSFPAPLWLARLPHDAIASPGLVVRDSVVYGESPASRTIYTVVSLVCISVLTGMLGKKPHMAIFHGLMYL